MPSDHVVTASAYAQDFPNGAGTLIDFKLHVDTSGLRRQVWRYERMFRAMLREGRGFKPPIWLDGDPEDAFAFPSWRLRARPFDWAHDPADLPATPPGPVPYPEQARLRLYLRPPPAVVQ